MGLLDTEVAKWKRAFGLLGGIPKTFKNNPRNAETMDAVFGFGGIIPGIGDAVSAAEAKYRYDQGDMLGAGLAGVGSLPMIPSLAGMFVGKGAKTWDVLKEAEAMKRLKAGENPAQVWRDTGVAVAPWDKQVRGEIADNAAKFPNHKPPYQEYGRLNNKKFSHSDYVNSYPDISEETAIQARYGFEHPSGAYTNGLIDVSVPYKNASERGKSTLMHELQHAIQQREGFARGGSPEAMRKILSDDPSMQAIYSSGELNDAYRRLAGEAEARLTQHRIPLSAEERLSQYPYDPEYFQKATGVPLDSLIVRFGDGPAMAINPSEYGLPVNPDGTVSLLHGTTKDAANKIIGENRLRSAGEPSVYLTNANDAGYGDGTLVQVDVDPRKLFLDDEFPGGRFDFSMPVRGGVANVKNARMYGDGPQSLLKQNTLLGY